MANFNSQIAENAAGLDIIFNNARVRAAGTISSGNPLGTAYFVGSGTPTSITTATNVTVSASSILTGIVVINPTGTCTTAFDTASSLNGAVNAISAGTQIGDYVECLFINGNGTTTLTFVAGSGGSFDTNQLAGSRSISAGASKYVMFRLTNTSPGAEAYTVYS